MIDVGYSLVNRGLFVVTRGNCEYTRFSKKNEKYEIIIHMIWWNIYAISLLKGAWRADIWNAPVYAVSQITGWDVWIAREW